MTASSGIVTIDTVKAISEVILKAIGDSELPLQQIADATGVQRASLSRFVRGQRTLRLDMADRLAEYFGLVLKPARKIRRRQ